MSDDEKDILLKIENGEITNWFQLEITANLMGFNISSEFIKKNLIKKFYAGDISGNRFLLFYDTILRNDVLDSYFEDFGLIMRTIELDGMSVMTKDRYIQLNALNMFKAIDLRNPRYLLKFFLHHEMQIQNSFRNSYYRIFNMVIERTKIRSMKMDVFKGYYDRLCERLTDDNTLMMMTN